MSDEKDRNDPVDEGGETRVLDGEDGATTFVPPDEVQGAASEPPGADAPATGAPPTGGVEGTRPVTDAETTAFHPDLTGAAGAAPASLLDQIELPLEVRLGRLAWPLDRVLALRVGDAVPVGLDGDDVVTLYVQGRPYATGELVVIDGRFGFRVRDLVTEGGA